MFMGLRNISIIQGEYKVSAETDVVFSTVLGSCIAACLHDPVRKIGGMNHFLLPGADPGAANNIKYGAHSMEQLINAMLRAGADRYSIQAQLFGGGNVMSGLSKIGAANAVFAKKFVQDEGFRLVETDIGGDKGRRLKFAPATGRAECVRMAPRVEDTLPPRKAAVGKVDLF